MGKSKTKISYNDLKGVIKEQLYDLLEEQGIDPDEVSDIEKKAMDSFSDKKPKDVESSPKSVEDDGEGDKENDPERERQDIKKPKKVKKLKVTFDRHTDNPFTVTFSERGFVVDDTRLNFDLLNYAISKEFNINLKEGEGLELTPVRMQKILKYEDRF